MGLNELKIVGGEAAAYTQRRANAIVNDFSHNGMGGMYGGYHNQSENIARLGSDMSYDGSVFYRMFANSDQGHHEAMMNPNVTYISVAFAHSPDGINVYCAMELFYRPADQIEEANESIKAAPNVNMLNLTSEEDEKDPALMQTGNVDQPAGIPEPNDGLVNNGPVKNEIEKGSESDEIVGEDHPSPHAEQQRKSNADIL